jgi:serine/threonine protein kinase
MSKNIRLEDFEVMKKLGEGQFGNVLLVTDQSKQNYYALKCISKQETVKTKLEKHLLN